MAKHAAASLGGAPINLTHLAVGDSNGTSYNPTATATALQNERYRTTITYAQIDENNPNQLIVEAIIDETVGPFYVREVGIFDSSGALFALGKFPETFKPNLPSGSGKKLYIRMILAFASTPQVNLVQSENLNYDPNFSSNVFAAIALKLAKAANLSDVADAALARNNLGLQIGVNVQAFAANLAALAGLTGASNKMPIFTGAGQMGLADLFSNKNAIMNGDFNIWQRGPSFPAIVYEAYSADGWVYYKSGSMVHDVSRSNDVPTFAQAGRNFNHSIFLDCQTIDSSIASGDVCLLEQKIEGYNYLPLAQKPLTLSFWIKASQQGKYCVSLGNAFPYDRSIVKEFTINNSNIWEYKTITFPPSPSSGSWNYTNGVGLRVSFCLAAGTAYQSSPDSWQIGKFHATSNQVNACGSVDNTVNLCGVQLEGGSIATPFEQRTFQQELLLCQRYYEKSYDFSDAPGAVSNNGSVRTFSVINAGFRQNIYFKVAKRSTPTITYYNPITGALGQIAFGWGTVNTANLLYEEIGTSKWTGGTNTTQTTYPDAYFHWTASSEL